MIVEDYMTTKEAAAELGVSRGTITEWIRRAKAFPDVVRMPSGIWLIPREDVFEAKGRLAGGRLQKK